MRLSPRLDNFLLKDWCKAPWFAISHCLPIASSEIDCNAALEKRGALHVEVTTSSDDPSYFLLVWNVATILQHFLFCKW